MSLRKDKQKILGEHFDDERIKSFLDLEPGNDAPYGKLSADFHVLEKAYRGMKADNFNTFIQFFVGAGRDLNAENKNGETFLDTIKHQRHATGYAKALKDAGATD